MNGEPMYSNASYSDSVPPFSGSSGNPYDHLINGMPSSFTSGKVSPLAPSTGHIPPVSTFHSSVGMNSVHKEYPRQGYPDLIQDRRLSSVSANGYQSEYPEEYTVNNGLPFSSSTLPHFQERLGRFQPDTRFPHSSGSMSVPSHSHTAHGSEILRGVAPHATHSYRSDGSVNGYDGIPHYIGPSHHGEMPSPMPTVDETLARMKLQGHSIMGPSNDLQTFIRHVLPT